MPKLLTSYFLLPFACVLLLTPNCANGAFIHQTASIDWLAAGYKEYFAFTYQQQFQPVEYQTLSVPFTNYLVFDKFDPSLGTLSRASLTIVTQLHTAILPELVGGTTPSGSAYPAFGDLVTLSRNGASVDTYFTTQSTADVKKPQYLVHQTSLVNDETLLGLYLNTVQTQGIVVDWQVTQQYTTGDGFSFINGRLSEFVKASPANANLQFAIRGGFGWHEDAYYLNPGVVVPPGTLPSYPPWIPARFRPGGYYDFQADIDIAVTYEYVPFAVPVPEPGCVQLCAVGLCCCLLGWPRLRAVNSYNGPQSALNGCGSE